MDGLQRSGLNTLYVTGEESGAQVALRSRRLGLDKSQVQVLAETQLEKVLATVDKLQPAVVVMDEPQALPETYGFATAGWNAGPVTGAVLERTAPLLGMVPRTEPPANPFPTMVKLGAWGTK